MSLWPLVFVWRETRNLSDAFIRLSDSYHGNELGYWRQFGEQLASTSTTPSIRIIEASKSASCNQKDRQEKKESEVRYMVQPRIMTPPDAETSAISTKDDFESQLYLGEVFVFYV